MSEENELPLAHLTEQDFEAGLDRFAAIIDAAESPKSVIEWIDDEAGDLLEALWNACGERLTDDEWDAMFAILPRIYAVMVPEGFERYEIDEVRMADGFAGWQKAAPKGVSAEHVGKCRQPLVMDDVLALLTEISANENVFRGASKHTAAALLAAAIDELDRTVVEAKLDEEEDTQS
jgi:hypothetical protein